jgi:hypothetical protein
VRRQYAHYKGQRFNKRTNHEIFKPELPLQCNRHHKATNSDSPSPSTRTASYAEETNSPSAYDRYPNLLFIVRDRRIRSLHCNMELVGGKRCTKPLAIHPPSVPHLNLYISHDQVHLKSPEPGKHGVELQLCALSHLRIMEGGNVYPRSLVPNIPRVDCHQTAVIGIDCGILESRVIVMKRLS